MMRGVDVAPLLFYNHVEQSFQYFSKRVFGTVRGGISLGLKISIVGDLSSAESVERLTAISDYFKARLDATILTERSEEFYKDFNLFYDLIVEKELTAIEQSDLVIIDNSSEDVKEVAFWLAGYCWSIGVPSVMYCADGCKKKSPAYLTNYRNVSTFKELQSVDFTEFEQ